MKRLKLFVSCWLSFLNNFIKYEKTKILIQSWRSAAFCFHGANGHWAISSEATTSHHEMIHSFPQTAPNLQNDPHSLLDHITSPGLLIADQESIAMVMLHVPLLSSSAPDRRNMQKLWRFHPWWGSKVLCMVSFSNLYPSNPFEKVAKLVFLYKSHAQIVVSSAGPSSSRVTLGLGLRTICGD